MTDFLTVEPSRDRAPAFAAWCLGRDPNVQTVSAGGFLVPLDWYPDVPSELLEGAYVDGYPYGQAPAQVSEIRLPADRSRVPKKTAPRKRTPRKTVTRKTAEPKADEK